MNAHTGVTVIPHLCLSTVTKQRSICTQSALYRCFCVFDIFELLLVAGNFSMTHKLPAASSEELSFSFQQDGLKHEGWIQTS